jgi:hypothetical protein
MHEYRNIMDNTTTTDLTLSSSSSPCALHRKRHQEQSTVNAETAIPTATPATTGRQMAERRGQRRQSRTTHYHQHLLKEHQPQHHTRRRSDNSTFGIATATPTPASRKPVNPPDIDIAGDTTPTKRTNDDSTTPRTAVQAHRRERQQENPTISPDSSRRPYRDRLQA